MDAGEVDDTGVCEDGNLGVKVVGGVRVGCVCVRLDCAVLCECEVVCAVRGEVDHVVRDAAGVCGD